MRYYPLRSHKHLQLGADVGIARMVLDSSVDRRYTSDADAGFRLSVGYDFDSTLRGPAFMMGLELMSASVEDIDFTGVSLFGRFVLK